MKRAGSLRFASIGLGVAARMTVSRDWGRRYLAQRLSDLPGLPAKMGQFLAGRLDWGTGIPPAHKAIPIEDIRSIVEEGFPRLSGEIDWISPEGHPASIGQVHRVVLKDGRECALKVQYPGVSDSFFEELDSAIELFAQRGPARRIGLDVDAYRSELRNFFGQEFDYRAEFARQGLFQKFWRDDPVLLLPEPFADFVHERFLVSTFIESDAVDINSEISQSDRTLYAQAVLRFLGEGILGNLPIHSDFHGGNWGIQSSRRRLVVYDFGSTFSLDERARNSLAILGSNPVPSELDCYRGFLELGFERAAMDRIRSRLPDLVEVLFEPVRCRSFNFRRWENGALGRDIDRVLGEDKWWFRVGGPPWFLVWMRALNGYIRALGLLGVPVRVSGWMPNSSGGASFVAAPQLPSSVWQDSVRTRLRVRVVRGGEERVSLELPGSAAERLQELMPEEVLEAVSGTGIDVASIVRRAVESGFEAQVLFEVQLPGKFYRIWLE